MSLQGRIFIARHGETVFNAAGRMQGATQDTPLTRAGFAQADAMGAALATYLGTKQSLRMYCSPSGRALQTLAIIAEHIGEDWHQATHDARLMEIDVGAWGGRTYAEIIAEQGEIMNRDASLFSVRPPDGERYDAIAARLNAWIADTRGDRGDRLVIMHGMSARVLRGILLGLPVDPIFHAPIAPSVPQGTIVMVGNGAETIVNQGGGGELA
jgi:glucosyl-3-phosphoglycerate phosphatase